MTSKEYPMALRAGTIKMMPLAANNPATRYDLIFHDTIKVADASTIAARLNTGVGPTFVTNATFPTALITHTTSTAEASAKASTNFEFFI
ncbi:MAG TPA: hypothetical protein VJ695_10875 [Nitrososphaera sp.]|nr:hypothetical protein [Nitrososphaera sp.]